MERFLEAISPRAAGQSSKKSSMMKGPMVGTTIKYKKYDERGASDIGAQVDQAFPYLLAPLKYGRGRRAF
jgi:hypothetical protein